MDAAPVLDILALAAALVDAGWWQGNFAGTRCGRDVGYDEPTAVNFCALGAFERACYELFDIDEAGLWDRAEEVLFTAAESNGIALIEKWNDHPERRPEEVIALFGEAAQQVGKG